MDKTLTTAATGLSSQQRYIEIISNNLANVNTTGFKKVRPEFQDLLYETIRPYGNTQSSGSQPLNEVQIGSGTELVATTKEFSQGTMTPTGNTLDIAITGNGFFQVRKPDNTIVYTRDGSFTMDKNGTIVTSQGYVLDPEVHVPDDSTDLKISRDGIITVKDSKDIMTEREIGRIQLARFINPGGLSAIGDNAYQQTPASGEAVLETPGSNNTGELAQGQLESSNVDLVTEMVNMIVAQRAYEINSKSVKTADDILNTAVNLKR